MATNSMTIGDLKGFIDLSKAMVGGLVITDFDQLFNKIEELLKSFNQWTPELEANLALARQELKANPGLFEIGKAEFVSSVDALLAKYPADTLLSDIPEFADNGSGGTADPDVVTIGDIDIARIQAVFADVTVKMDPVTKIVTVDGAGYSYKLPNIERIEFDDGVLAFDIDGNAGQVFRLYQASFGREPDADGLKYWVDRIDTGLTDLAKMSESFLRAPEFIDKFGTEQTVSNAAYIELLYLNALKRAYDLDGYNYWINILDSGMADRGDLLALFSESDENKSNTQAAVDDGIWIV